MLNYFYRPIVAYNGKVLKCAGIATADNRQWLPAKYPGTIELAGYHGDRIRADDHSEFTKL